jgi:hypothetical protein
VDHCDLCEREATAAAVQVQADLPALVLLCSEHAAERGITMESGGATCLVTERKQSGEVVYCGAAATHVQLIGFYEDSGAPRLGFSPVWRRHAGVD